MNFNQTLVRIVAAGIVASGSSTVLFASEDTQPTKQMSTVGGAEADARLTDLVRFTLLKDPVLANERIVVTAKEGLVTLSGIVDQDAKRNRALEIASHVPGVREVRSDLELRASKGG